MTIFYIWEMNSRLFNLLVVFMSISLIGIIFVQGYWILDSVKKSEEQFSIAAKQLLISSVQQIQKQELDRYYLEFAAIADNAQPLQSQLSELFQFKEDDETSEFLIYTNSLLQEDYKLASPFLSGSQDSIEFRKYVNRKVTRLIRKDGVDGPSLTAVERYEKIQNMDEAERFLMNDVIRESAARIPIHKRVDTTLIRQVIQQEMNKRNLISAFEFGIYSNDLPTKIRTANFEINSPSTYGVSIFDNNNDRNYQLLIDFKDKNAQIINSVKTMGILSGVFTLVIILAFSTAISQLFKQRQISEIKTDFINNMTHEFKTPIATINLALDSINNPKIFDNKDILLRYLKMIRDENKRMHAQVENVLRISKLERNELDIDKDRVQMHELITQSINHVDLIVKDRNGYIKTHFSAAHSEVLANESHMTNVIVNILDNAIKYSLDEPKIDVFTENIKNFIVVKISDQGAGMSKPVQKRIFEKFYREHTGDVHNVKGHGLGLAYVKRIVEDHHGEITVESEKGVGSSFFIKLPLIS